MPYVPFTATDEVLNGSPLYNINGTPNQTIALSTPVLVAGTPINAALLNNINTGIVEAGGLTDSYKNTTSTTGNIGAFVLNGTTAYGTVPASVGQLTNGTSTFELVTKFKINATSKILIAKTDTSYSATNAPKGWHFGVNGTKFELAGWNTNGATVTFIESSTLVQIGTTYWIKLTFDGTTITMWSSIDGINWISEATSTNSNLITALSTSDNVLTQIGREWRGSSGYISYFNGTIYSISLTKSGTLTNRYEFKNFGTNTAINDSIGGANGVSAGSAVQGVSGTNYACTTGKSKTSLLDGDVIPFRAIATAGTSIQPTLAVDTVGAKQIIGADIIANKYYNAIYNASIDNFIAVTTEEKLVASYTLPVAASSFTIGGLDINRDGGMYEIVISNLKFAGGAGLYLFVNGDTTVTNYYSGTTINGSISTNNALIMSTSTTNEHQISIPIIINNNKIMAQATTIEYGATGGNNRYYSWLYKNTLTNLNSFTLSTGGSPNISTATVKIYKK